MVSKRKELGGRDCNCTVAAKHSKVRRPQESPNVHAPGAPRSRYPSLSVIQVETCCAE